MVGVLDVGEELAALADEVEPPAQEIAGGSHLGRVDVGLGKHPAPEQAAILWASILSFLALAPWMAFM